MGFKRYGAYLVKRTQRLRASPHAVAAGVASGAAVSVFPFIGFHFILGFIVAFFTRGSMLAAAIGTAFGNPFTFPFIFAATYNIGRFLLPGEQDAAEAMLKGNDMKDLVSNMLTNGLKSVWPVFEPLLVGAIPLSIVTYLGFYAVVRILVTRARARRAARLRAKHHPHSTSAVPKPGVTETGAH